jgi:hypothetical protein
MADFNGNKVFGRLMTDQACYAPPKMLKRKPGRCSEPLEQAKKEHAAKGLGERILIGMQDASLVPKHELYGRLFKSECERWPDQIPESFLDEQRQRLIDHQTGKNPLPPEESLRLRRDVSTLEDIYRPGPRFEAGLSAQEQAWLDARNLRNTNSLEIALLGPIFGGLGAATRMLGGSEQQVAAANQAGAIVFDLATSGVGAGRMGGGGAGRPMRNPATEYSRGAPLEPLGRPAGTAQGAGVKPAAGEVGALAKPPPAALPPPPTAATRPAAAGPGRGLVVNKAPKPPPDKYKTYKTHGLKGDPADTPEGRRLIKEYENQGMSPDQASRKARELMETGSSLPLAKAVEPGDHLYKVVPEGNMPGPKSEYWMTKEELGKLQGLDRDQIASRLGLPLENQQTARFSVVEIRAMQPTTSFTSVIAPTTQNGWSQSGGGLQTLLPNRNAFTPPVNTGITLP